MAGLGGWAGMLIISSALALSHPESTYLLDKWTDGQIGSRQEEKRGTKKPEENGMKSFKS